METKHAKKGRMRVASEVPPVLILILKRCGTGGIGWMAHISVQIGKKRRYF
jgi:hypothetical protein